MAATLMTGTAIILESTLSFLALGVRPPTLTLGNLVSEAKGDVISAPHRILFPGLFITLIVLSINFLGDGLVTPSIRPASRKADMTQPLLDVNELTVDFQIEARLCLCGSWSGPIR
ncbi:MAG: hypothetical protein R2706_19470 [Acidimicrobiales bacterium]